MRQGRADPDLSPGQRITVPLGATPNLAPPPIGPRDVRGAAARPGAGRGARAGRAGARGARGGRWGARGGGCGAGTGEGCRRGGPAAREVTWTRNLTPAPPDG